MDAGRAADALSVAGRLADRAAALGDRVGELCGRALQGMYRMALEPEGATDDLEHLLREALPVFEASGRDLPLFVGYYALSHVANMRRKMDAVVEACELAAVHARRAGTSHESRLLAWRGAGRLGGTTPIRVLLAWLDEQESRGAPRRFRGPLALKTFRATALASLGRFGQARELRAEYETELADRGDRFWLAVSMGWAMEDELLAGDPDAAVRYGQEACRLLDQMDQRGVLSTVAAQLAGALCQADRLEEAAAWAARAADLGASDDVATQYLWRQATARVLARHGEHAEAEQLGREAIAITDGTDDLHRQGNAYVDLAEVLSLAGRPDEAVDMLKQAPDRYERKGVVVMVARTRERLQALQRTAAG